MKKIITAAIIVLGLLIVSFYALNSYIYNEKQVPAEASYKEATYRINGESVQLDGVSTKYFGNEYLADLDNDGRQDVVFLLTQETGGSGTFYYAVAALNTERGYVGSEVYLLGDRVAPQSIEASQNPRHKNVIVVNYVDRAPGEPMTVPPSVGRSVYLKLEPISMSWGTVEPDFTGEADSAQMTLAMKEWVWQMTEYSDGRTLVPAKPDAFTLAFSDQGMLAVGTDCNSVGGEYLVEDNFLIFSNLRMTRMYCEGSQESEFMKLLENTVSFHFTGRGELIFDLRHDSGTVTFR